ncbi:hypothetical protein LIER_18577 [Lithospermum erythrorhizon]|uniref:Uncharacterized protein n=1 Tax=Lithospermum erythrorhizon TaxID=34254 RepID=A0AAV3QGU3_LITER
MKNVSDSLGSYASQGFIQGNARLQYNKVSREQMGDSGDTTRKKLVVGNSKDEMGLYRDSMRIGKESHYNMPRNEQETLRPWICIEDFNEITSHDEKRGGILRDKTQHRRQRFRFEAMWIRSDDCTTTVNTNWTDSSENVNSGCHVIDKLKKCRIRLLNWSKHEFGNVKR